MPTNPDAPLLKLEADLTDLLLRYDELSQAWPRGDDPLERAKIAQDVDNVQDRIGAVMAAIAKTPARTPQGLAVQLRRVQAAIASRDRRYAERLLTRAVAACEGMVVAG